MSDTASDRKTGTHRTGKSDSDSGAYHHGDLRRALLDAVGEIIGEKGVGAVSLREAARRAGVSHGAPAHHFGDKVGLITAYTIEGFERFGAVMQQASDSADAPEDRLTAIGIEYLRFAMEERAYFEVMFRAEMHNRDDVELSETTDKCFGILSSIATEISEEAAREAELAGADPGTADERRKKATLFAVEAWTKVHGLATLWLDGALTQMWDGDDIYELALEIFDNELD